jgi:hypothetical protein
MGKVTNYSFAVTVIKWLDKRNLTMVSTYRSADTQRASNADKELQIPWCVIDCNYKIGERI